MNVPIESGGRPAPQAGWIPLPSLPEPPGLVFDEALRNRERRIFWILVGVWIVNLFDLNFTLMAHELKVLVEINPVAARVLPHGPAALTVYKLGMLALGTAILWWTRRCPLAEKAVWAYALVCVGLCVWWHRYFQAEPVWILAKTTSEFLITPSMMLAPPHP